MYVPTFCSKRLVHSIKTCTIAIPITLHANEFHSWRLIGDPFRSQVQRGIKIRRIERLNVTHRCDRSTIRLTRTPSLSNSQRSTFSMRSYRNVVSRKGIISSRNRGRLSRYTSQLRVNASRSRNSGAFFYKKRMDGNDRRKNRNEMFAISRDLYR